MNSADRPCPPPGSLSCEAQRNEAPPCHAPCCLGRLLGLGGWLTASLALAAAPAPIQLTDVTAATGIDFVHTDGSSGERYIVETVSCGIATFDYDQDGLIDIYFLNGAPLRGTVTDTIPRNQLYRNLGNWQFQNVTAHTGLGDPGYALGVAVGDYDNDGDPDVYINNFGPNVLYRNDGSGRFTDVTQTTGVANGNRVGAGTCFLDMDADGDLDLYVANYVNFTYENHRIVRFNGYPAYVGPMDYQPTPDNLYRNNGDGTFTDVSAASGINAHPGTGMGMVCADVDDDGDTDVFVGNDVAANFLMLNNGQGVFEEAALLSGVAYDFNGGAQGTMGVDCGDYDNDGLLDLFLTSYQQDTTTLYRNLGQGMFADVTLPSGAGQGTLPFVTWGCAIVDFDNDTHRDLFIGAGHLHDNVELFDNVTAYENRNFVMHNQGNGRFLNVTDNCGDGLQLRRSSRGAAFDDLDNDGDIDAVIVNSRREPTILRNDSLRPEHHWLQVELRGVTTNRDAVGSRVTVTSGDLTLVDEVHSGRGYQGHHGSRLHFGLGRHDQVDHVEVRWLGGPTERFTVSQVDQRVRLTEGQGTPLRAEGG